MRTTQEQLTAMIRIYGFEHEAVIEFANLIERGWTSEQLEPTVKAYEKYPVYNDEEE